MSYPNLLTPEEMLNAAKERLSIPAVVVICGSMRFEADMQAAAHTASMAGKIVVMPHVNTKLWHPDAMAKAKPALDDLHRAKIRLASEVLVVGDYIGDSTRAEIAYARSLGKPVRFTHPEVDPGEPDGDPATEEQQPAEACGKCRRPFDPADQRFDGHARHRDTPYCRRCVDACHESTDAFHRCAICQ